jgi:hypothetical protein
LRQQKCQFQLTDKQSEKEDDAQTKVLIANKTSSDIKPNPTAGAIASKSWWKSPEAHTLFCNVKRSTGDNGDCFFLENMLKQE